MEDSSLAKKDPGHDCSSRLSHVDAPAVDEAGQHVGEVALRVNAVQLAGFHERCDGGPACATIVAGGEQRVLPTEAQRPAGLSEMTCSPEMAPFFGRVRSSEGRANEAQQVQR